jgi:hypothetical protein
MGLTTSNSIDYRVKTGRCNACHKIGPMHLHHIDYEKPIVVRVCASCHKKIHMYLSGKQRKGSNPYINPLIKLQKQGIVSC